MCLQICKSLWRICESYANILSVTDNADIAQLVEHQLPKLRVAGPNPVVRSRNINNPQDFSLGDYFL